MTMENGSIYAPNVATDIEVLDTEVIIPATFSQESIDGEVGVQDGGWYHRVPKEPVANLLFRRSLLRQAELDPYLQDQLWLMCQRDFLFFFNVFCYIFEPRSKRPLPFITWPVQDKAIQHLVGQIMDPEWIRRDTPIEKSRDMGLTWLCIAIFVWIFVFHDNCLGGIGSRTQELVEDKNNHKALFWKIDYILDRLPPWMRPKIYKAEMKRMNLDNGSSINGDSTNPDMFRSDRLLYVYLDEFAAVRDGSSILKAVRDVTFCVIMCSTHQGVRTAFYETIKQARAEKPESILRVHWRDHPFKSRGLYTSKPGESITILDENYPFPKDYPFIMDGRLRSVAYDNEARTRHPREMAQEWDIDPAGADWQYFDGPFVEMLKVSMARPPIWRGEIEYRIEPLQFQRFVPTENGRFLFWCELAPDGWALRDRQYAIGADCARGVRSSNSVLDVGDRKSRELVCEFADARVKMDELAEIAAALGQCFGGMDEEAFLMFEANGPGSEFKDFLWRAGYRNVYMRVSEKRIDKKKTKEPGWWCNNEGKKLFYAHYYTALREGTFINRSMDNLDEHHSIVWTTSDVIKHVNEIEDDDVDPAGAGYNHGDRVTAAVLCNKAMGFAPSLEELEENETEYREGAGSKAPEGTFAARFFDEFMESEERSDYSWR